MNTQNTLGPWVYDDKLATVFTEDNEIVVRLLPPPSEMPDGAVDTELLHAVGTLIAASPELLDALSECIHTWEHHNYIVEKETGLRILASDEMVVNAKKLIAKLTDQ